MKNFIAAVLVLFSTHTFQSCKNTEQNKEILQPKKSVDNQVSSSEGDFRVAFIYGDSVNARYKFLLEAEKELESERKLIEQRMQGKLQRAEKRAAELQQQAPTMTQSEMQEAQLELQSLEMEMQQFQEKLGADFRMREIELQKDYVNRVNRFLEAFNDDGVYDMVLNFQQGGNLLWIKQAYNITDEVIDGLNDAYQAQLDSIKATNAK